jgi:hypothetical protein
MQIANAVGASNLPRELRHTILAMAHLANHATGKGFAGQKTIAKWIGCKDRQLRDNLRKIDGLVTEGKCPVAIRRVARMSVDGRGRTSDEYQLELIPNYGQLSIRHNDEVELPNADQPAADRLLVTKPTGSAAPLGKRDQPAVQRRPTGSAAHDQPAVHRQGSWERSS